MMIRASFMVGAIMLAVAPSLPAAAQDMQTVKSANDFAATRSKLVESAKSKGFAIVAEIDHAAAAKANTLELRPTHLIIFGNPRGGTPLMGCNQTVGIDLPLKALVWQAADGTINVTVNTPALFAGRHRLGECGAVPMANMGKALEGIVGDATKP